MPLVKTALFTILVPGAFAGLFPWLLSRLHVLSLPLGWARWLGVVPIVLGALVYLGCAWKFATTGQGTPAPIDAPKVLVREWLYQRVRNPMYVGIVFILIGETLLLQSLEILAYAAVLLTIFHLFVVFYEEPALRKKFGPSYDEYCRKVPRWIPRPRS